MSKIAILNVNSFGKYYPEHIAELEQRVGSVDRFLVSENIDSESLANLVGSYEYIILGTTPNLDKDFFKLQKNVKLITRHGIGFNHIDTDSAKSKGIPVCKVFGHIERDAVAEQALTLLAACSKRILLADQMVRNNEWKVNRERLLGTQLSNKVTGIIGLGNIGTRFAEIMKYGLRNKVLVYDPNLENEYIESLGYIPANLDFLLEHSDFVSLNCDLNPSSFEIINKKTLAKMKSTAILINTARGALINETDLFFALKNNDISFFGTDVMKNEPIDIDNPLLSLKNVIISPHVGVYNEQCIKNMDLKVMEDIYLVECNKPPLEVVNE